MLLDGFSVVFFNVIMLLDGFEMNLQIEYLLGLGVLTVCSSTWPLWCLKCLTTKQLHYEWDNNNVIHCTVLSFVAFGIMLFSHVWIYLQVPQSQKSGACHSSLCNAMSRFLFLSMTFAWPLRKSWCDISHLHTRPSCIWEDARNVKQKRGLFYICNIKTKY